MSEPPTREDALLLACARSALGHLVERPETTGIRWSTFVERLIWHGLHATLQPVVLHWYGEEIPAGIAEELRAAVRTQAARNLRLLGALREIDGALRAAGAPYVVLKGLPLAQTAYGTVAARRCRDIDLLVPPPAFRGARRALEGIGFTSGWRRHRAHEEVVLRFAPDLSMTRPDGALVELHHGFERHSPRADADRVRALLNAATPVRVGDVEVPAVVGPAALPYLAWHGTRHAWFRFFWLYDVATLTTRAGVAELEAVWETASVDDRRFLAVGWSLAEELLGVPVPAPGRAAAAEPTVRRLARLSRARALQLAAGAPAAAAARRAAALRWALTRAPGPLDRARILAHYLVAVQPEDVEAVPLPASLGWLYPALRPARVALRLAASLLRPARSVREAGSGDQLL